MSATTSTLRLLHLGFFFRKNIGDDMFVGAFKELYSFSEVPLSFKFESVDDVKPWGIDKFRNFDVIVVGGGDIINEYFCNTFIHIKSILIEHNYNIPIILIGAGVPHPSFLTSNKIYSIDKIGLRNKIGSRHLQQLYGTENVISTPDFGFMYPYDKNMKNVYGAPRKLATVPPPAIAGGGGGGCNSYFKIGLAVAQPVNKYIPEYSARLADLCDQLAASVSTQLPDGRDGVQLYLIPFNISNNAYESDLIINREIVGKMKCHLSVVSLTEEDVSTVEGVMRYIESMDLMICHRFHSHVFSISAGTPFVSLDFSRKVQLLLKEAEVPDYAVLGVSVIEKGAGATKEKVLNFDASEIASKIMNSIIGGGLLPDLRQKTQKSRKMFETFFTTEVKRKICRFVTDTEVVKRKSHEEVVSCLGDGRKRWDALAQNLYDLHTRGTPIPDLSEILCFRATGGTPGSKYTWGTSENLTRVFKECLTKAETVARMSSMIEYIEKEEKKSNLISGVSDMNVSFIEQDSMKGLHRAGWSFCIRGIKSYKENTSSAGGSGRKNGGIYADMYVDKTFGWALPSMKDAGIVPYLAPWCGFLHHTPSREFGSRSIDTIFAEPLFKSSLASCVALFCLSEYLCEWVRGRLVELSETENILGADPKIVKMVYHPTEFVESFFEPRKVGPMRALLLSQSPITTTTAVAAVENGGESTTPSPSGTLPVDVEFPQIFHSQQQVEIYKSTITYSPKSKLPEICRSDGVINIVNIGAWYRNPTSIYRIAASRISDAATLGNNDSFGNFLFFRLKGRGMENYFPSKTDRITKKCLTDSSKMFSGGGSEFMKSLNKVIFQNVVSGELSDPIFAEPARLLKLAESGSSGCPASFSFSLTERRDDALDENTDNEFVKSLAESVRKLMKSVTILEYLPDDQYDLFLQTSVVFIDFVDCSAANTIIECLVRNTPMITNRIPPTEEYFGKDYPLLFTDISEVMSNEWLTPARIFDAYKYLKMLDKSYLKIENFITEIDSFVKVRVSDF